VLEAPANNPYVFWHQLERGSLASWTPSRTPEDSEDSEPEARARESRLWFSRVVDKAARE